MSRLYCCLFCLAVLSLACPAAARDELIAGPVAAQILRVIDGDTLLVEATPWPQQRVEVYVRLRGIDTPELRSSCPAQRETAQAARQALADMTGGAGRIWLKDIAGDKYFGRIVADVMLDDGRDPAQALMLAGLAVAYDGGRKQAIDCGDRRHRIDKSRFFKIWTDPGKLCSGFVPEIA